jgi:hypothetical protein
VAVWRAIHAACLSISSVPEAASALLSSVHARSMDGTLRHVRDWQDWDYCVPVWALLPPDNLLSSPSTLPLSSWKDTNVSSGNNTNKGAGGIRIKTSDGQVLRFPCDTLRNIRTRIGRPFCLVHRGRVIEEPEDEDILLDDQHFAYQAFFCV